MWTAENTYHTYLHILQNTSCIRKPQVISKGGGGGGDGRVHTPTLSLKARRALKGPSTYSLFVSVTWKNATLLWENIAAFTGGFSALLFAMPRKPPGQSFCPFLSAIVFNFAHFSSLICSLQYITYTLYILHVCDFVMLHVSLFT